MSSVSGLNIFTCDTELTCTQHAEAWQGVIWHMLVSDPRLMKMSNKWESLDKKKA